MHESLLLLKRKWCWDLVDVLFLTKNVFQYEGKYYFFRVKKYTEFQSLLIFTHHNYLENFLKPSLECKRLGIRGKAILKMAS